MGALSLAARGLVYRPQARSIVVAIPSTRSAYWRMASRSPLSSREARWGNALAARVETDRPAHDRRRSLDNDLSRCSAMLTVGGDLYGVG
jgi:hypothetical protein